MIVGSLIAFYAVIAFTLYFFQEDIIFLGVPLDQGHQYHFQNPFEELTFKMDDGASINALHFKSDNPKGIIYYHHGNAGNLDRWGEIAEYFLQYQYDVLIYDYRGYGKSIGVRTEEKLYSDSQYIYDHLKQNWNEGEIIVYGRSLGTGVACQLLVNNSPGLLILETPFYSLTSVAKDRFPIFPTGLLTKYELPNWKNISKTDVPIFIFHGTDDAVIPYQEGKKLYESVAEKSSLITVEGGGHNDLIDYAEYREGIAEVLNNTVDG